MKLGLHLFALAAGVALVGFLVVGGARAYMVRGGAGLTAADLVIGALVLLVGAGAWGLWILVSGPLSRWRGTVPARFCQRCGAQAGPQDGACNVCGATRLGPDQPARGGP